MLRCSERVLFETVTVAVVLIAALIIGLTTAGDYGATIDEFNTNDYGPKALAWYTSGFTDRSQFETVEFSLWYYGPWFQMVTAVAQSLELAEPLTIRHAVTFVVGLIGMAAVYPIGRLSFGSWVGPCALALCLLTGYLYGNLFFAPIDTPFLATMCWALLAIMVMARTTVPTWPATVCAGMAIGLAIATHWRNYQLRLSDGNDGIVCHRSDGAHRLTCASGDPSDRASQLRGSNA